MHRGRAGRDGCRGDDLRPVTADHRAAAELPFVDEHGILVAATRRAVWEAIPIVLQRTFDSPAAWTTSFLLGCGEREGDPFPPIRIATLAGFRVVAATHMSELALEGSHRFSRYALTFRIDDVSGQTRVRAETRAEFPRFAGKLYRALVIGSGGHEIVVRRLLRAIRRRAEHTRNLS